MAQFINRIGRLYCVWTIVPLLLAASSAMLLMPDTASAQGRNRTDIEIDHSTTGFPLSGGHAQVVCERCHLQGIFRGTPTQCMQCHSPGGRIVSTFKPANHLPTTVNCSSCHRTTGWTPAFFTHNGVAPGTCNKCHNQSTAVGKPVTHIPTTMSCDSCHKTTGWMSAGFTHQGIAPGTCTKCHNGVQARGKPAGHMPTTSSCDACHKMGAADWVFVNNYDHAGIVSGCANCHNGVKAKGKTAFHVPTTAACETCHKSTTTFLGTVMNHTGIVNGCATCHNGTTAMGKPATHVPTTAACETCHKSTTTFVGATFSHTGITTGCANCHNGTTATGKPAGHFVTTQSCEACHRPGVAWSPVTTYVHKSAFYKPHRAGVLCSSCHTSNNEVIAWRFAGYKPDCAGCHAGDYKPGSHKKVDSPQILYNVMELKDCTGSCHLYTNATFTTISKSRTNQHRSTDGGF